MFFQPLQIVFIRPQFLLWNQFLSVHGKMKQIVIIFGIVLCCNLAFSLPVKEEDPLVDEEQDGDEDYLGKPHSEIPKSPEEVDHHGQFIYDDDDDDARERYITDIDDEDEESDTYSFYDEHVNSLYVTSLHDEDSEDEEEYYDSAGEVFDELEEHEDAKEETTANSRKRRFAEPHDGNHGEFDEELDGGGWEEEDKDSDFADADHDYIDDDEDLIDQDNDTERD